MKSIKKTSSILEHLDEMFPIVRASELSLDEEFMKHTPNGIAQERVLSTLTVYIPLGITDFRRPKVDPSFDEDGNLVFGEGRKPGVGKLLPQEWKNLFEQYLPQKHSHMATDIEYDIFCGFCIRELVKRGYDVERAWYEVCNESSKLGHYWDSHKAKGDFEPTGSRPILSWCDLANTKKFITKGKEFFEVSGAYKNSSQMYPIAHQGKLNYIDYTMQVSVGLMLMDV